MARCSSTAGNIDYDTMIDIICIGSGVPTFILVQMYVVVNIHWMDTYVVPLYCTISYY